MKTRFHPLVQAALDAHAQSEGSRLAVERAQRQIASLRRQYAKDLETAESVLADAQECLQEELAKRKSLMDLLDSTQQAELIAEILSK